MGQKGMSAGKPQRLLQYTSLSLDPSGDFRSYSDQSQQTRFGEDNEYAIFIENLKECGHSYVFEMLNEEDGSLIRIKYEDEDNQSDLILCQNTSYCSIQKIGSRMERKTSEKSANPRANKMQHEEGSLNTSDCLIQRNESQLKNEALNTSDCLIQGNGRQFKKKTSERNANPRANQMQHQEGLLNKSNCLIQRNGSQLKKEALNTSDCLIQGNGCQLKKKTSERHANPRANQMQHQEGLLNKSDCLIQRNGSQLKKEALNTSDCLIQRNGRRLKKKTSERNANPRANQMQHQEGLLNKSDCLIQRNGSQLKKEALNTSDCLIQRNGRRLKKKTSERNANPRANQMQHQEGLLNKSDCLIQRNGSQLKKEALNTSDCLIQRNGRRLKKKTSERNANPRANQMQHQEGLLNKSDRSIQRNGSRLKIALNTSDFSIQGNGSQLKKKRSANPRANHMQFNEELLSPPPSYYYDFLNHARPCHGNMTLKVGNGTFVKYGEAKAQDEQGSLHGRIYTSPYAKGLVDFLSKPFYMNECKDLIDAASFHKLEQENRNRSFELKHDEEKARDLKVRGEYRNASPYKKRLADVLSKPFDLAEYNELYNAASTHKLVQKDRNLRSRTKVYDTNVFAPSYLDRFPDFAERINMAGFDPDQCLILLRGFFFWLKNLCHQGAFKPWLPKDNEKGEYLVLDD